jgi:glycosyltransferase involved in cell wall biosynthesis
MAPRHILVIPSWYADGRGSGGGYFRDQALALGAAGHRVALLVPEIYTRRDLRRGRVRGKGADISVEHGAVEVYRAARRVVVPRMPFRNALAWSRCGWALFCHYTARNGMPDLVHAHSCLNAGVLAALIKRRCGVPFLLTEHSTLARGDRPRWWERRLIRQVIRRADRLTAVSPYLADLLGRQFPGSSWACLGNILGQAFLAPAELPAGPDAADRRFTFACAARLSPEKNHVLLLEAFAAAFAGDLRTRLDLAGDGPLQPALRRLCGRLGIAPQVRFLGMLPPERLRAALAAADAFVLASDRETFAVAVIEAQAAGLPVVSTASGGPDDLIDQASGRLVPCGDRSALRDALVELRRHAGEYDRAAIRAAAIRRFGQEAFLRRFAELAP